MSKPPHGRRRSTRRKDAKAAQKATQPPGLGQRLAKAFAHPLRAEMLTMLNEKPGSPKDLVDRLEKIGQKASLNLVSYHIRVLDKLKCVEVIDRQQIRGATKTVYRGTTRMLLDEGVWPSLSKEARIGISAGAIGEAAEQAQHALEEGTFDNRSDRAIINLKMSVDEQGWQEIQKIVREAYERCEEVEPAAINRSPNPEERFRVTVSLLAYESPNSSCEKT